MKLFSLFFSLYLLEYKLSSKLTLFSKQGQRITLYLNKFLYNRSNRDLQGFTLILCSTQKPKQTKRQNSKYKNNNDIAKEKPLEKKHRIVCTEKALKYRKIYTKLAIKMSNF